MNIFRNDDGDATTFSPFSMAHTLMGPAGYSNVEATDSRVWLANGTFSLGESASTPSFHSRPPLFWPRTHTKNYWNEKSYHSWAHCTSFCCRLQSHMTFGNIEFATANAQKAFFASNTQQLKQQLTTHVLCLTFSRRGRCFARSSSSNRQGRSVYFAPLSITTQSTGRSLEGGQHTFF